MPPLKRPVGATHKVIDEKGTFQFFYGQEDGQIFYSNGKPMTKEPAWAGAAGREVFEEAFYQWTVIPLRTIQLENK